MSSNVLCSAKLFVVSISVENEHKGFGCHTIENAFSKQIFLTTF